MCVICNQIFTINNWLKTTFLKGVRWAQVKLLWPNIQKYNDVHNYIYEVCESTCHECSTKDEVENDKRNTVLLRKQTSSWRRIWNISKYREKKKTWKLGVHSIKESSEKAMEVNIELRLNVDEQEYDNAILMSFEI